MLKTNSDPGQPGFQLRASSFQPIPCEHLQKPHNAGSQPQAQFFNTFLILGGPKVKVKPSNHGNQGSFMIRQWTWIHSHAVHIRKSGSTSTTTRTWRLLKPPGCSAKSLSTNRCNGPALGDFSRICQR